MQFDHLSFEQPNKKATDLIQPKFPFILSLSYKLILFFYLKKNLLELPLRRKRNTIKRELAKTQLLENKICKLKI